MQSLRIPRVRQHDVTDCGAACLDSIARYHGRQVPIAIIRQYAGTDRHGTNLTGLVIAAERLGFTARGVRAPVDILPAVPKPAIAHLADGKGGTHFVVLYGATDRSVVVMDPGTGEVRRIPVETFQTSWTGVLLLLAPDTGFQPGRTAISPIARFWQLSRPHRAAMAQAAVGAIAYTMIGIATAVFVQKIVDHVIPGGNRDLLELMSAVMFVLVVSQLYLGCTRDLLVLRTGQRIDAGLIHGYYLHLLRLPQRFFDTMRVGEVISRVNDAVKIRAFVNETCLGLFVNLLIVVFSFGLMFVYSWQLALLVGASIPLFLAIYWCANRANRRDQRQAMESAAELESHLVESIGAASTLRRLGLEQHAAGRMETRLVRLLRPVYAVGRNSLLARGAAELVSRTTTVVLLWVGTVMVLHQSMTPGELMSFYALHGHLAGPVLSLIAANRSVQDALIASDRLYEILDLDREVETGSVQLAPGSSFDAIRFKDVRFHYGSRPPMFEKLSLSIFMGDLTAIVGESGSGKSTLAAMIQRLYAPDDGQITLGNLDIRSIRRESLLRSVSVVPQEAVLFNGSVIENLTPGEESPELPRVVHLCDCVGIRDFIETLPHGFETPLGERGVALSGGQRQRLAIARALYRRPRVLVLDEATSALDAAGEAGIHTFLRGLMSEGVTIIIITHRLTSAMSADRILVLELGRLVEHGTHGELLAREGAYSRLWRHQMAGVLPPAGSTDRAQPRFTEAGQHPAGTN